MDILYFKADLIAVQLKKVKRNSPQDITEEIRAFLSSTITALLEKMKWDEDSDMEDMDEDDKHTFESFRKVHINYCSYMLFELNQKCSRATSVYI